MHRFASSLSVALLLALTLSACGSRLVAVGPPRGGTVTQTDDVEQVRAALARALRAQRFTVESDRDGKVIARLDHGARTLRVRIEYDADSYRIAHESSTGFAYQVDPRTQQPVISPHYPKFVLRLDRTIQQELQRPAEEAREAAEAEQEAIAAAAAQAQAQERAEERRTERQSRREARRERRARRRERWAEMERDRQATERERLRAERAAAEAEAERLRRQPIPVIADHEPVYVERMAFDASHTRGGIRVRRGRASRVVRARAVGRFSSRQLGLPAACPGFWSADPQHVVTLPRDMDYLRLEITARADTTLAVVTPDGQVLCDDDSAGEQNPRLAGRFPAGTYAIYVGTYERGEQTRYALSMDESQPEPVRYVNAQPRRPAPRVRARQQPSVPDCRSAVLRAGHSASSLTYCRDAEPHCAAALIAAGHSPSGLTYCRNVDPTCAVELLRAGQSPSGLTYCR